MGIARPHGSRLSIKVNKTTGFRIAVVTLVVFLIAIGIAGYKTYSVFYNQILELSEAAHLRVEEVSGTSPLRLKITTETIQSAPIIRSVTIERHDREMTVLYHLAISGLAKPTLNWGEAYSFTVPDSVNEVRFGRQGAIIWRRSKSGN